MQDKSISVNSSFIQVFNNFLLRRLATPLGECAAVKERFLAFPSCLAMQGVVHGAYIRKCLLSDCVLLKKAHHLAF